MDRRRRYATAAAILAIAASVTVMPVFAADRVVTMAGFAFSPKTVTVNVGDSVAWHNDDTVVHNARGSGFFTGGIGIGGSKSITFDSVGTYPYICTIHPSMTGTVIVRAAGSGAAPNTDMTPIDGSDGDGWLTPALAMLGLVMIGGTLVVDRLLRRRSTR
jgi:plastocyanin